MGGGRSASYSYDLSGNLTGADDTAVGSYSLSYYTDNRLKEITLPGGSATTCAYWENDLPRSITTRKQTEETAADFTYSYDAGDLPVSSHVSIDGNPASGDYSYSYDPAGRLTRSASAFETVAYAYDPSGNMAGKTLNPGTAQEEATTCSFDAANRLVRDYRNGSGEDNTYSYDEAGNLTGIGGGSRAQTSYTYDALGRMRQATVGSPLPLSTTPTTPWAG